MHVFINLAVRLMKKTFLFAGQCYCGRRAMIFRAWSLVRPSSLTKASSGRSCKKAPSTPFSLNFSAACPRLNLCKYATTSSTLHVEQLAFFSGVSPVPPSWPRFETVQERAQVHSTLSKMGWNGYAARYLFSQGRLVHG